MRLKIVTVGEPVLRATSQMLSKEQILSPSIQNLIDYMRETVRDAPGVGLAAPQVGESLQLAVIEDKAEYHKNLTEAEMKERGRAAVPFHVLVNPVLEVRGESTATFFEGCLSLPGFTALVPRAKEVRVTGLDHRGEPRVIEASGWYARILQHEIDHLHGTLYIDRMHARSFSSLENYTRHWKDRSIDVQNL
ncbi:peptide deformylase [Granulicella mallensis]|uniref:Peptide deformylase n=1 Tax=Granulicella mallensis (strain ATCC BAA-1857 / DSM 23137 / MP5ACTX8) TaxID=682795 RepID=G8NP70_GRAMM|nr:peptide deformylase [Granulicella mallensis]AEU38269.1 peptide deformylase [Granulicella mallensis MP5ACTX8]